MNALFGLVQKDLKMFCRDRRAVVMSFAAPILIGTFFGYVFGGNGSPNQEQGRLKVLVVNQEQGAVAQSIIEQLGKDKTLEVSESALEAARDAVRKGKVPVAIVIPPQFGEHATQALFTPTSKLGLRTFKSRPGGERS